MIWLTSNGKAVQWRPAELGIGITANEYELTLGTSLAGSADPLASPESVETLISRLGKRDLTSHDYKNRVLLPGWSDDHPRPASLNSQHLDHLLSPFPIHSVHTQVTMAEAIGVIAGVLGIIQFGLTNFKDEPGPGSTVKVAVALDGANGGTDNGGGDLPDV